LLLKSIQVPLGGVGGNVLLLHYEGILAPHKLL
jgi:hypothetical protein